MQVIVATSGARLLPHGAVKTLIEELLPLTTILTPNIPEAQLLLNSAGIHSSEIRTLDDLVAMAKAVRNLGPQYVLLKGGHLPLTKDRVVPTKDEEKHVVVDILYDGESITLFESDFIVSKNTHGTGCSLACTLRPQHAPFRLI